MLPDKVTFDQAARFGYIGTSFAALRGGSVGAGTWLAINGITGTLGVGATLLGLGMGATRILGFGRNRDVLARLKALRPRPGRHAGTWATSRSRTGCASAPEQLGVDVLVDCSARGASARQHLDALNALKRGGIAVNIGALTEPLPIEPMRFMTSRIAFQRLRTGSAPAKGAAHGGNGPGAAACSTSRP